MIITRKVKVWTRSITKIGTLLSDQCLYGMITSSIPVLFTDKEKDREGVCAGKKKFDKLIYCTVTIYFPNSYALLLCRKIPVWNILSFLSGTVTAEAVESTEALLDTDQKFLCLTSSWVSPSWTESWEGHYAAICTLMQFKNASRGNGRRWFSPLTWWTLAQILCIVSGMQRSFS